MLLFQGIGAHVPQFIADPLLDVVLPLWSGADLPPWWVSGRFARNLVGLLMPGRLAQLPERWQGLQFAPLVVAQILAILGASRLTRRPPR